MSNNVLESQKGINLYEQRLPALQCDLATCICQCNKRLGHLQRDLKIALGDIQVVEVGLKLTECKSSLIQLELPVSD